MSDDPAAKGLDSPGPYLGEDFEHFYRVNFAAVAGALRAGGSRPEQADDLAQAAFVRTLARWRTVQRGSNPVGYVYRTAIRMQRRAARRPQHRSVTVASPDPTDSTLALDVQRVLASMPRRQRCCATLRYVAELGTSDIAKTLGISESTVRVHLHRARAELVAVLELSSDGPGERSRSTRPVTVFDPEAM